MLGSVTDSIRTAVGLPIDMKAPNVLNRSAITSGAGAFDAVITDPPYYDAIPYSDLMDIFMIWHRRILHDLGDAYATAFSSSLGAKWDSGKNDGEPERMIKRLPKWPF